MMVSINTRFSASDLLCSLLRSNRLCPIVPYDIFELLTECECVLPAECLNMSILRVLGRPESDCLLSRVSLRLSGETGCLMVFMILPVTVGGV